MLRRSPCASILLWLLIASGAHGQKKQIKRLGSHKVEQTASKASLPLSNRNTNSNSRQGRRRQLKRRFPGVGEHLSPTSDTRTSSPSGPKPVPRPPAPNQPPSSSLHQNSLEQHSLEQHVNTFACTPPQFLGVCTSPHDMTDECQNVGAPCEEGSMAGEHCCVDLCGRKYCTAKGWWSSGGSQQSNPVTAFVPGSTISNVDHTNAEDDENVVEIDLTNNEKDGEMMSLATDVNDWNPDAVIIALPSDHHENDVVVGEDVYIENETSEGASDTLVLEFHIADGIVEQQDAIIGSEIEEITTDGSDEIEQHANGEPTMAPNNNVRKTMPPTLIITRPVEDTPFPTESIPAAPTRPTTSLMTPSPFLATALPASDLPTLTGAPFFMDDNKKTRRPTAGARPTRRPSSNNGENGYGNNVNGPTVSYISRSSSTTRSGNSWASSSSSSTSSSKSRKAGKRNKSRKSGKHQGWQYAGGKSSKSHGSNSSSWSSSGSDGSKSSKHSKLGEKTSSWSGGSGSSGSDSWSSGKSSKKSSWSSNSSDSSHSSSSWSSGSSSVGSAKSSKRKSGK